MIISFLPVLGKLPPHPLLDRYKTVIEILLKDMAMKSLVLQLKLMTLVMVYVKICARGNASVYCNKAIGSDRQNHAVAGVIAVHTAI